MDYEAEVQRLKNHNHVIDLDRNAWKKAAEKYKQLAMELSVLISDESNFLGIDEYGISDDVAKMLFNETVQELLIEHKRKMSVIKQGENNGS